MALNIGREGWIGVGLESTYGSPVAITDYVPFTSNTLRGMVEKAADQRAFGVRDKNIGSIINKKWSEGDIGLNVDTDDFGLFLYGALGTVNTATVSGSVKDHTFTRNNSNTPKSLTIVNDRTVDRQYYPGVAVKTLEISVSDNFAEATASLIGKSPITTTSGSLTTASGNLLAFKDGFFGLGSSVAGAAAASNQKLSEFTVTIENNTQATHRHGNADPDTVDHGEFEVSAEGTLLFEGTTNRDTYYANAKQAAVFKLTGAGIGGGLSESLTLNFYQIRIDTWELETGLADFFAENFALVPEWDNANSKTIDVVLRNLRASY